MAESAEREELVELLSGTDIRIFPIANAALAVTILREQPIDCFVIGPGAPTLDLKLFEPLLFDGGSGLGQPAVIFYGPDRAKTAYEKLRQRLKDRITLREATSRERLLEQTTFFLHRNPECLSEKARQELESQRSSQQALTGRKVLIVDDDMRNIFALATVLDEQGMVVMSADNGREAIQHVEQDASIDIVLMDIMMPEMDGITTIQEIRKIPARHDLPIIAVTAKAMKGDREKCIAAGAWDYLSKPVNTQDLLAALRAWLKD
jgi:CheY-like chemotaxis protein